MVYVCHKQTLEDTSAFGPGMWQSSGDDLGCECIDKTTLKATKKLFGRLLIIDNVAEYAEQCKLSLNFISF